ncbi:MAG: NnrS family protein, partial [Pararhizobium sp.]
ALAQWVFAPGEIWTALSAFMAAGMHMTRLVRWRGWTTKPEPLVAVLHIGYLFVPIGFAGLGIAALGAFDQVAALHVINVGTVAGMMLAVMTRATRGHTGRVLTSSRMTNLSYVLIFACAIVRPMTGIIEDSAMALYAVSAICWVGAFTLYLVEYGPMLVSARRKI